MFETLSENLAEAVQGNPWVAPLAAFAGGLLTAANPCVIAMVPLMVAYVAGQQTRGVARSFLLSLAFAIGLTIMFGILFLATWVASSFLRAEWWAYVAGGVCLLMGLHLLGAVNFRIPAPAGVQPRQKGLVGAFLLGLLFGLVSLPCAGPVLLALLAVVPLWSGARGRNVHGFCPADGRFQGLESGHGHHAPPGGCADHRRRALGAFRPVKRESIAERRRLGVHEQRAPKTTDVEPRIVTAASDGLFSTDC